MCPSNKEMLGISSFRPKRSQYQSHWSKPTRTVISTLKPSTIATNIERCLNELSITASFDNEKMITKGQTCDQINFQIRLFSVKNKLDKPETIVELTQFTSGQFGFHKVADAILKSATGESFAIPETNRKYKSIRIKKSPIPPLSLKSQKEILASALERAETLLCNDRYDLNSLGIQSLLALTDKQSCCKDMVVQAAKSILCENTENSRNLKEKIHRLIVLGKSMEVNSKSFFKNHHHQMRIDAIKVLSQCFETLSSESSTSFSFDCSCSKIWLEEDIITALMDDVLEAEMAPHGSHIAYAAFKCLHQMFVNSSNARNIMKATGRNVEHILLTAKKLEKDRHALLAAEAKKFIRH